MVDVVLGAVLIVAALTDSGDAAGRGLAQVYAVGCVVALLALGAILGVQLKVPLRDVCPGTNQRRLDQTK